MTRLPAHPLPPDFSALVEVLPADGEQPGDPAETLASLVVEAWRRRQERERQDGDQGGEGDRGL